MAPTNKWIEASWEDYHPKAVSYDRPVGEGEPGWEECLEDDGPSPEDGAFMTEVAGHIRRISDRFLTPQQRRAAFLYLDGLSTTDIAARLGVSRQAAHRLAEWGLTRLVWYLCIALRVPHPRRAVIRGIELNF